ncbi:MAG: hypothetical protein RL071_2156 [Pseudomonadota bacterium]
MSTGDGQGDAAPTAFKHWISPVGVRALLQRVEAALTARFLPFHGQAAAAQATAGLEGLELKARVIHVADAINDALPGPRDPAVVGAVLDALIEASGPAATGEDDLSGGFPNWPLLSWVERHALDHPALALPALGALTARFSAEFAVRPFVLRWPDQAWAAAARWAASPDLHQRRLASEGTRPRLPWGLRLGPSVADPRRGLALIDRLIDDPSAYVRRSVANHLNDVSKDHPDLAAETAARWMHGASPARAALVSHALRGLRKAGHPGALAALGLRAEGLQLLSWSIDRDSVQIGDFVAFRAALHNDGAAPVTLSLDLLLRWPALRGGWSRRQLHWTQVELGPGERRLLTGRQRLKVVTTRRVEPGPHRLALLINGEERADAPFTLIPAEGA